MEVQFGPVFNSYMYMCMYMHACTVHVVSNLRKPGLLPAQANVHVNPDDLFLFPPFRTPIVDVCSSTIAIAVCLFVDLPEPGRELKEEAKH